MRLAAQGLRNMDGGDEPIGDPAALRRVRHIARGIHVRALGTAVILAGIALLLPGA